MSGFEWIVEGTGSGEGGMTRITPEFHFVEFAIELLTMELKFVTPPYNFTRKSRYLVNIFAITTNCRRYLKAKMIKLHQM